MTLPNWIYLPILALILLTIFLWLLTAKKRISAVVAKQLSIKTVALVDHNQIPQHILLPGKSYDNQFQQPLLFIVLLGFLAFHHISAIGWQIASWVFVVARFWHCYEHLRCNNIRARTIAFALASTTLFTMWIVFLIAQLVK